jgi:hypothetical protein
MATQSSSFVFRRFLRRWWPFIIPAAAAIWTIGTALGTGWWTVHQSKWEAKKFLTQLQADQKARDDARDASQKARDDARDADQKARDDARIEADLVRRIQAQQPFLQTQLELYLEAGQGRWKTNRSGSQRR